GESPRNPPETAGIGDLKAAPERLFHVKHSERDPTAIPENGGFSAKEAEFLAQNLPDCPPERLQGALTLLGTHLDELETWAPRLNLVGAGSRMEWLRRHFLDSLLAAAFLEQRCGGSVHSLVDIGSGAGFPGLPLAAMLQPRRTILIEPRQRRAHFLRAVVRRRPEIPVEVANTRLESFSERLPRAAVVSRATFSDQAELLKGCLPWTGEGSIVMALCAPSAPIPAGEFLQGAYEELAPAAYRLPGGAEDHQLRFWRRVPSNR
ncbi:class I SAM-dependent methyltransferase, partial [Myxococcota bacterium]|nr:class I SAM-dependent methyltransferase [Myxococcota bacterium]